MAMKRQQLQMRGQLPHHERASIASTSSNRTAHQDAVPAGTVASRVQYLQNLTSPSPRRPNLTTKLRRREDSQTTFGRRNTSHFGEPATHNSHPEEASDVDDSHSFQGFDIRPPIHNDEGYMTGESDYDYRSDEEGIGQFGLHFVSTDRHADSSQDGRIESVNATQGSYVETGRTTETICSDGFPFPHGHSLKNNSESLKRSEPLNLDTVRSDISNATTSTVRRQSVRDLFDDFNIERPEGLVPRDAFELVERHHGVSSAHRLCHICSAITKDLSCDRCNNEDENQSHGSLHHLADSQAKSCTDHMEPHTLVRSCSGHVDIELPSGRGESQSHSRRLSQSSGEATVIRDEMSKSQPGSSKLRSYNPKLPIQVSSQLGVNPRCQKNTDSCSVTVSDHITVTHDLHVARHHHPKLPHDLLKAENQEQHHCGGESEATTLNRDQCSSPACLATHSGHTPFRHSINCLRKNRGKNGTDSGYTADTSRSDEEPVHHHVHVPPLMVHSSKIGSERHSDIIKIQQKGLNAKPNPSSSAVPTPSTASIGVRGREIYNDSETEKPPRSLHLKNFRPKKIAGKLEVSNTWALTTVSKETPLKDEDPTNNCDTSGSTQDNSPALSPQTEANNVSGETAYLGSIKSKSEFMSSATEQNNRDQKPRYSVSERGITFIPPGFAVPLSLQIQNFGDTEASFTPVATGENPDTEFLRPRRSENDEKSSAEDDQKSTLLLETPIIFPFEHGLEEPKQISAQEIKTKPSHEPTKHQKLDGRVSLQVNKPVKRKKESSENEKASSPQGVKKVSAQISTLAEHDESVDRGNKPEPSPRKDEVYLRSLRNKPTRGERISAQISKFEVKEDDPFYADKRSKEFQPTEGKVVTQHKAFQSKQSLTTIDLTDMNKNTTEEEIPPGKAEYLSKATSSHNNIPTLQSNSIADKSTTQSTQCDELLPPKILGVTVIIRLVGRDDLVIVTDLEG